MRRDIPRKACQYNRTKIISTAKTDNKPINRIEGLEKTLKATAPQLPRRMPETEEIADRQKATTIIADPINKQR